MSTESEGDDFTPLGDAAYKQESFPKPVVHKTTVMNHLASFDPDDRGIPFSDRETLFGSAQKFWKANFEGRDNGPHVAVEDFTADWLPDADFALVLSRSRWKAGTGQGSSFKPAFQYHVSLREWESAKDRCKLRKPALSFTSEIIPQFTDLVYQTGDPIHCPYGEGTRLLCTTTWASKSKEVERRLYDGLGAVFGADSFTLDDRVDESRRIQSAEAHIRFHKHKMGAAIETLEQSKHLIAYGGHSRMDADQKYRNQGWLEAVVDNNRWDLLGFEPQRFSTSLKIYRIKNWHKRPPDDPLAHPKMEAWFEGVNSGRLPHVDDWDEVLTYLRTIVATHAHWAGIERQDLIVDDFFEGPDAPKLDFELPTGRREMLRERYEDLATEIFREAMNPQTMAVYDILKLIAENGGATYDYLAEESGIARSTVRYHVGRLAEKGVVARIGNPVIVLFESTSLKYEAEEILQKVHTDDIPQDREKRKEHRRAKRENRKESGSNDEEGESSDDIEIGFKYLDEIEATPVQIAEEYERDQLRDKDIRVRVDELPNRLR